MRGGMSITKSHIVRGHSRGVICWLEGSLSLIQSLAFTPFPAHHHSPPPPLLLPLFWFFIYLFFSLLEHYFNLCESLQVTPKWCVDSLTVKISLLGMCDDVRQQCVSCDEVPHIQYIINYFHLKIRHSIRLCIFFVILLTFMNGIACFFCWILID